MRRAICSAVAVALGACGNAGDPAPPASANDVLNPAPAHEFEAPLPPGDPPVVDPTPVADTPPTHIVTIASIGDAACTFELQSADLGPDASGAPRWAVSLMKTDTHSGSCTSHKGTIMLAPFSYERPVGVLALVADTKMLAVSFDGQVQPTAVIYTRLVQVDYETGQLLHEGEMVVNGTPLWPPAPFLRPTALDATGHDVVLRGSGDFPGAGGGTSFVATYMNFLDIDPQRPSPADSAYSQ